MNEQKNKNKTPIFAIHDESKNFKKSGFELNIINMKEELNNNGIFCKQCYFLFSISCNYDKELEEILIYLKCGNGHHEKMFLSDFLNNYKSYQINSFPCSFCFNFYKKIEKLEYCYICKRLICINCKNNHILIGNNNNGHIIKPLKSLEFFCERHNFTKNEYYCSKCKKYICHICLLDKRHSKHPLSKVQNKYEINCDFKKLFDNEEKLINEKSLISNNILNVGGKKIRDMVEYKENILEMKKCILNSYKINKNNFINIKNTDLIKKKVYVSFNKNIKILVKIFDKYKSKKGANKDYKKYSLDNKEDYLDFINKGIEESNNSILEINKNISIDDINNNNKHKCYIKNDKGIDNNNVINKNDDVKKENKNNNIKEIIIKNNNDLILNSKLNCNININHINENHININDIININNNNNIDSNNNIFKINISDIEDKDDKGDKETKVNRKDIEYTEKENKWGIESKGNNEDKKENNKDMIDNNNNTISININKFDENMLYSEYMAAPLCNSGENIINNIINVKNYHNINIKNNNINHILINNNNNINDNIEYNGDNDIDNDFIKSEQSFDSKIKNILILSDNNVIISFTKYKPPNFCLFKIIKTKNNYELHLTKKIYFQKECLNDISIFPDETLLLCSDKNIKKLKFTNYDTGDFTLTFKKSISKIDISASAEELKLIRESKLEICLPLSNNNFITCGNNNMNLWKKQKDKSSREESYICEYIEIKGIQLFHICAMKELLDDLIVINLYKQKKDELDYYSYLKYYEVDKDKDINLMRCNNSKVKLSRDKNSIKKISNEYFSIPLIEGGFMIYSIKQRRSERRIFDSKYSFNLTEYKLLNEYLHHFIFQKIDNKNNIYKLSHFKTKITESLIKAEYKKGKEITLKSNEHIQDFRIIILNKEASTNIKQNNKTCEMEETQNNILALLIADKKIININYNSY